MIKEIDQSNFNSWLEHPVTVELYHMLTILSEDLAEMMLNPSVVLAPDGQINYARAVGNQEIIGRILDLRLTDFIVQKEEERDDE